MNRLLILALGTLLSSSIAQGQDVRVQVATEEPPFYVGSGAIVQLTVDGFDARPEPMCMALIEDDSLRATVTSKSPRIFQQMIQSGNQIKRVQRVTYVIQIRVIATEAGQYEVGPFLLSQGKIEKRVDPIKMTFREVPSTDDMQIKLLLPEYAYPDQRVPVTIQWWFAGNMDNVSSLNIHSPVFDQFTFAADDSPGRRGSQIPILTEKGVVTLPASVSEEQANGKTFAVVSAQRTLIPDRVGTFELKPISASIELVTRWENARRSPLDGFGIGSSLFDEAFGSRRRPSKIERYRAEGKPLTLDVRPFPNKGRPESFSGAVGKGFAIDVAAQRSVVRVGDPIRLTVTISGDGNVEGASLPALSADGGLDPNRFRLPDDKVAGVFDKEHNSKQFQVQVRVLDESVVEIPSIAYSWFDAEREEYNTARSDPIALRVTPAKMVGADAVLSANSNGQAALDPTSDQPSESTPADDANRSYSLAGADLAIQTDPAKLLVSPQTMLSATQIQVAGYAVGSACLLIALVDLRRRKTPRQQQQLASSIKSKRKRIKSLSTWNEKGAAQEIAEQLRPLVAELSEVDRALVEPVISHCETIAYRPGESGDATNPQLIEKAVAVLDLIRPEDAAQ